MGFYKGKKVLVTGGAGFIGSNTVEQLVEKGAIVTIPLRNKDSDVTFLKNVKDKVHFIYGDLLDFNNCLAAANSKDIVMNLAARVGGIEYNIKHPGSIFRENITVFLNILEASRINNVEQFLTVSSACVYPRFCTIPTPEEEGFKDSPEPTNEGYGWAKRMEEFMSRSYYKEYGMSIAIARPYNAYGPRDNFSIESSHVIPALIRKVHSKESKIEVWGSGKQSRSFLFVDDFARGLLEICEKYTLAEPINVGADEETTIKDLVIMIMELSKIKKEVFFDTNKPEGQPRRKCDTAKAKKILGFEAKVKLKDGLKKTIEYYKENIHGKD